MESSVHIRAMKVWSITKTYLYNFDPLKPNFYIVKLGFAGVYTFFLISALKHRLWVLVRTASARTDNLCFEQKYIRIFIWKLSGFFCGEIFNIRVLNRLVFVMQPRHPHSLVFAISLQNLWEFQNKTISLYRKALIRLCGLAVWSGSSLFV